MMTTVLPLLALALGYPVGLLFFGSLHRVSVALAQGNMAVIWWQALRMVVLGLILYGAVRLGALVLIALVVGMMIARHRVLTRIKAGS